MASLETICSDVRARFGLAPTGVPIDPDWLLTMLDGLEPEPLPFCERDGLFGNKVRWNECAPRATQRYQIARACCTHILRRMRQLQHSPHALAVMLCGVSSADTQVAEEEAARAVMKPMLRVADDCAPLHYVFVFRARDSG